VRKTTAHFMLAAVFIVTTAIFLRARTRGEYFPSRLNLQSFPSQVGEWRGTDIALEKETREVLGPGDFLLRVYQDAQESDPYIDLFIAYFPSQRAGDTIHSPKNCLPGAGWAPVHSSRIALSVPGHSAFPVNRYLIAKGDARELVLYWYWAHDRGVASEYLAKYYLVADSIKMNRSDGALVRLTTPLSTGETVESAQQRMMPFVSTLVPQLNSYIPR
jgi:EpsI family protein